MRVDGLDTGRIKEVESGKQAEERRTDEEADEQEGKMTTNVKSFKESLMGRKDTQEENKARANRPMRTLSIPIYEGDNLIVDLDEEEYLKGIDDLKYSVVGRLYLRRGIFPPTTMDLKKKLMGVWGIESCKIVPMGSGHFHVIFNSFEDQSSAMAHGPVNISPGIVRVSRWYPGFDLSCLKSTAQVWIRLYGMPLEFRKE